MCTFLVGVIAVAVVFIDLPDSEYKDLSYTKSFVPPEPDAIHTPAVQIITEKLLDEHDTKIRQALKSVDPYQGQLTDTKTPREVEELDGYLKQQKSADRTAVMAEKLNTIAQLATEFREALRVKSALERQLENGLVEYSHKYSMAIKIKERILEIQKQLGEAPKKVKSQVEVLEQIRSQRESRSKELRNHELQIHQYPGNVNDMESSLKIARERKGTCENKLSSKRSEVLQNDKLVDNAITMETSQKDKCNKREIDMETMVAELQAIEQQIQKTQMEIARFDAQRDGAGTLQSYKEALQVVTEVERSYSGNIEDAKGMINDQDRILKSDLADLEQKEKFGLSDNGKDQGVENIGKWWRQRQIKDKRNQIQTLHDKLRLLEDIHDQGGITAYKNHVQSRIDQLVANIGEISQKMEALQAELGTQNQQKQTLSTTLEETQRFIERCNREYKEAQSSRQAAQKKLEDSVETRRRIEQECETLQQPIGELENNRQQRQTWYQGSTQVQDAHKSSILSNDQEIKNTEASITEVMDSHRRSIGDLQNELQVLRERSSKCEEHQRFLVKVKKELEQSYTDVKAVAQKLREHNVWKGVPGIPS